MKLRPVLCLAWLATTCWAAAQRPRPGEPTSEVNTYGAAPSTQPQMFQKPPPATVTPNAANITGNSTQRNGQEASLSGNLPTDDAGNTTTTGTNGTLNPAIAGNIAAPTGPGTPTTQPTGPDYSSFVMPISMDNIDNEHQLVPGDKILVQIVEDREPRPNLLFVNENGTIQVPWIGKPMPVEGLTLRDAAEHLKEALQGKSSDDSKAAAPEKKLDFYQDGHPTVLATYFSNDRSRGRAVVEGEVNHPDYVSIPMDGILTLSDAIRAAGGFSPTADREHVVILHHDLKDPSNDSKETVNMADLMAKIVTKPLLPGDMISVPSLKETGASYNISGKGAGRIGRFPLQPGMTVSDAVSQSGSDHFSKLYAVQIKRDVKDPQTGQPVLDPKTGKPKVDVILVDVEDILNNGNRTNDKLLQNGDWIVVDQKMFAF